MTQSRQPLVLEGFIAEVMGSPLEAKTKEDTLKVLNCLIYIRDNLSVIQFAVDNKNEPGLYRYPKDRKKGVLRDTHGTSFHLNSYSSGEVAVKELQELIAQVEHAIQTLPKNRHHQFAEQFRYDEDTGCLERRVGPALQWAVKVMSSPLPQLDDIMLACSRLTKPGDSIFQFAKNYCVKNNITRCIYEGEDVAITEQLLKTYATDILAEDGEDEKEDDSLTTDYKRLSQSAVIVKGRQGMWQFRFNDSVAAVAFLDWVKKQGLSNIHKAAVKKEAIDNKSFFIVRLTLEQYEALKQKNSSDKADVLANKVMKLFFNNKPDEASRLLASASHEVLNQTLVIVDDKGQTPLYSAALKQSPEAFKALVEKASVDAINKALVIRANGQALLTVAAEMQSSEAYKTLVEKASVNAINKALVMISINGETPLGAAAYNQSPEAFMALVEKASVDAINKALVIVNAHGVTPLNLAALKQFSRAFKALVEKASVDAINKALIVNINGEMLSWVAEKHSHEAFKALVEKASDVAINKALVIVNVNGVTLLSWAAEKQSPEAFKALVEKASVDAINKALVIVNVNGVTPLSWAAFRQSPEAFKALVAKATLAAVSQACLKLDENKKSVLDYALGHSPDIVAYLLEEVDDNALDFLLKRPDVSQNIISTIAKNITHEPSWQSPILLGKLFKSVGASLSALLTDPVICAWIAGNEISPIVIEQMKPALTLVKDGNSSPNMKKVADGLLMMTASEPQEKNAERFIFTRFNKIINIKDLNEETLKIIWEEGLKSAIDYHTIKHHLPNSIAAQMADDLFRAERLFMGCVVPFKLRRYQEHKDYSQLAKNNHLACKIIKKENWSDFVAQLRDYQKHRPALRTKIDKTKITHKFLHRTGEIIPYQLHEKVNKKKDYAHTKKQSATLLSENLNTAVFGQHDPNRQLVGVLADISCHFIQRVSAPKDDELTVNTYFLYHENNSWQFNYVDDDKRRMPIDIKSVQGLTESLNSAEEDNSIIEACVAAYHNARIIKAMLCYDRGTFDRKWVGNQKEVEKYAAEMKQLNFTNLDAFRKWANKNPSQVNEILMKFSRGSLLAIVIATDTLEARKIAMERYQNILSTFKLDLPIVFYANTFKQMSVYTLAQQADDDVGKNILLEADCQFRLNALKDRILKNPLTGKAKLLSLFGTTPEEIILNWIENMNAKKCLPSIAFMKINALIDPETKEGKEKPIYLELQKVIDDPYANRQASQSADTLLLPGLRLS